MDKINNIHNDEYYTPLYAIKPLEKYLKPQSTIWCPFDVDDSLYVKRFKEINMNVINTHINNNENFFDLNIDCDYIISNPPYSLKNEVFAKLFELNKPFAMLLGSSGIFESKKRFDLFKNKEIEIMLFNTRIFYLQNYTDKKTNSNPPFSSIYICHNILPKQLIFEEVNKKDVNY